MSTLWRQFHIIAEHFGVYLECKKGKWGELLYSMGWKGLKFAFVYLTSNSSCGKPESFYSVSCILVVVSVVVASARCVFSQCVRTQRLLYWFSQLLWMLLFYIAFICVALCVEKLSKQKINQLRPLSLRREVRINNFLQTKVDGKLVASLSLEHQHLQQTKLIFIMNLSNKMCYRKSNSFEQSLYAHVMLKHCSVHLKFSSVDITSSLTWS